MAEFSCCLDASLLNMTLNLRNCQIISKLFIFGTYNIDITKEKYTSVQQNAITKQNNLKIQTSRIMFGFSI